MTRSHSLARARARETMKRPERDEGRKKEWQGTKEGKGPRVVRAAGWNETRRGQKGWKSEVNNEGEEKTRKKDAKRKKEEEEAGEEEDDDD